MKNVLLAWYRFFKKKFVLSSSMPRNRLLIELKEDNMDMWIREALEYTEKFHDCFQEHR